MRDKKKVCAQVFRAHGVSTHRDVRCATLVRSKLSCESVGMRVVLNLVAGGLEAKSIFAVRGGGLVSD